MGMVQEQNLEKQIEKQMGCMSGFLQIFDRHQLLTGKRFYSTKRLTPPSQVVDSSSELEKPVKSPAISNHPPSPDRLTQSPVKQPTQQHSGTWSTTSTWKFREAPRLSLDSRATVDAKGSLYPKQIRTNPSTCAGEEDGENHRKSTSVVARLMGLEPLPNSIPDSTTNKSPQLRRSASESRVSRDLLHCRFFDGNTHFLPNDKTRECAFPPESKKSNPRSLDPNCPVKPDPVNRGGAPGGRLIPHQHQQRKSFFDAADFFPEPKQQVSLYGEIEKRLKMRGIGEPSKDVETLKQILEALQLKGLLHYNKKSAEEISQRNFFPERCFESLTEVTKPFRSPVRYDSPPSSSRSRRSANVTGDRLPSLSPRRDRPVVENNARSNGRVRSSTSPTRSENSVQFVNSAGRRKPLNVETPKRRGADSTAEQRRVSPVHSPRVNLRKNGVDQARSPRNRRPTAEIYPKDKVSDESSSISESSFSTSSQNDAERTKMEEYNEGRSILQRCDKLLHSIAEMTAPPELQQPSPVSVLDSSFYKDESSSPSPVMKRSIDFKDLSVDFEDEIWSSSISAVETKTEKLVVPDDSDFVYISDVLRASNCLPEDSDVFLLLEKQQYLKGKDTSKVSTLERRLIFDTITEILNRNRQLPPWKAVSQADLGFETPSLQQVWSEFKRIRERDEAEDLFAVICGVLKKDLAGDNAVNEWRECHVEFSDTVLDIERLIFKDLIGETIRELAFVGKTTDSWSRRKLLF